MNPVAGWFVVGLIYTGETAGLAIFWLWLRRYGRRYAG